jgi:hypothetical protein
MSLAALREAGRDEGTVGRYQVVLNLFVVLLAGRGLDTASERVCLDFIANQTGVTLGCCNHHQTQHYPRRAQPCPNRRTPY